MPVGSNRFSMYWPIGPAMALKQMCNRLTVSKVSQKSRSAAPGAWLRQRLLKAKI